MFTSRGRALRLAPSYGRGCSRARYQLHVAERAFLLVKRANEAHKGSPGNRFSVKEFALSFILFSLNSD